MTVSGFGRNLFSFVKAMHSGVSIILKTDSPHLQFNSSISLRQYQHPDDKGLGSYDVFFVTTTTTPRKNSMADKRLRPRTGA